jgi:hypothetical protein
MTPDESHRLAAIFDSREYGRLTIAEALALRKQVQQVASPDDLPEPWRTIAARAPVPKAPIGTLPEDDLPL